MSLELKMKVARKRALRNIFSCGGSKSFWQEIALQQARGTYVLQNM